jgi:hypothetical protein
MKRLRQGAMRMPCVVKGIGSRRALDYGLMRRSYTQRAQDMVREAFAQSTSLSFQRGLADVSDGACGGSSRMRDCFIASISTLRAHNARRSTLADARRRSDHDSQGFALSASGLLRRDLMRSGAPRARCLAMDGRESPRPELSAPRADATEGPAGPTVFSATAAVPSLRRSARRQQASRGRFSPQAAGQCSARSLHRCGRTWRIGRS